ncbi:MAG: DUF6476 family protein [Hyphomicrobiaceae bacterium]
MDASDVRSPASNAGLTPSQARTIRTAFIAMTLSLMLGLAIVIGSIFYIASREDSGGPPAPGIAEPAQLSLPSGAEVKSMALTGNRLAVHFVAPSGAGIVILDIASGREVRRVKLAPGAPAPGQR